MREQIEILVKLQAIDSDIQTVNNRLSGVAGELSALDSELHDFKSSTETMLVTVDELQKNYRSLESDVNLNLSKMASSKGKLSSVKTNKEYQSLLKEIEDIDAINSKLEDKMLEILEQIDQFDSQLQEKNRQFESVKKRVAADKIEIEQAAEADRETLSSLQKDFKTVMATVAPEALKVFTSVRSRVGNLTIAKVENAVCAGCHVNIPPQMYNELQRFESLMYCPHCQRIIYTEL
jgi:uncharacterized protein